MKRIFAVLLALTMCVSLAACAGNTAETTTTTGQSAAYKAADISIAALKGPTGIGMAKLISDSAAGTAANNYTFTLESDPTQIVALVSSGEVDIAACPLNLAATLYKKTNGGVQMLAINTLGVLYVLENGKTISDISDLKGKTIYATGQGSSPEYILNYILTENSIKPGTDVNIEYLADHSELAAKAVSGDAAICVLPEPFVTTALSKNSDLRIALDLTEEWNALDSAAGSKLAQGCIIATTDFAQNNAPAIEKFLEEYEASVDFVNSNVEEASAIIAEQEILPSAAIAKAAIPNCNITFITGSQMKTVAQANFNVLYNANPTSVGGALPDDDFYFGA